jgi:hypothetical protein
MAIRIKFVNGGYVADVTPPHSQQGEWACQEPLTLNELIAQLRKLGCHTTDIGDALYEADPHWETRLHAAGT